jgi:hypothetical protein
MDKIIIGEITLILLFFIIFSNHQIKTFLMETIIGHILLIIAFITYYYLDKYIGVIFCFMVLSIHYSRPIETFYTKEDVENQNLTIKSEEYFRKTNCNGNELLYKGKKVKNDMVEHIFPEINFENNVCNPCDKNCEIAILEQDSVQSKEQELGVSTLA